MFIVRKTRRQSRSVADSWQRLERWFARHVPEVTKSLRPAVPARRLGSFEQASGLKLPLDVRESFLIHDGQEEVYPGAIVGEPLDSLEKCESTLGFYRQLWEDYRQSDTDTWIDDICTSSPKDAIHCQDVNPKWIPMGDWDGNCYGIDLDPGPNGVHGQVINFGRDEQNKFVLALSWAEFLEDIADELEAGNLVIGRDSQGGVTSFGRRDYDDQALFRFYADWSKAKLPVEFQQTRPAPRTPEFPGEAVTGHIAKEGRARVRAFIQAMHDYELYWLRVRPIHKLGYRLVMEGGTGHRLEGLKMGKCSTEICSDDRDGPNPAPLTEMQMGVHVRAAVEGYQVILKEHCTDRRRGMVGEMVQVYPPYFDPDRNQIGDVRQVSSDTLLVYVKSNSDIIRRYHLKRVHGRWLIDVADETKDHVRFARISVLFGFH